MAFRSSGSRMTKQWNGLVEAAAGFTGSVTTLMTSLIFTSAGTVIRTLCEYTIVPTPGGTFADGDHVTIGIGLAVVSGDAVTIGSTAMPDPVDDPGYPWLYWQQHKFLLNGTPIGSAIGANVRHSWDSRSMRKLKASEALALIVQYKDVVGAPPMTVLNSQVRFLLAT